MGVILSKPIATPVALALIVAVLLWLSDFLYGRKQVEMIRVGGTMNQCTCSQRMEK